MVNLPKARTKHCFHSQNVAQFLYGFNFVHGVVSGAGLVGLVARLRHATLSPPPKSTEKATFALFVEHDCRPIFNRGSFRRRTRETCGVPPRPLRAPRLRCCGSWKTTKPAQKASFALLFSIKMLHRMDFTRGSFRRRTRGTCGAPLQPLRAPRPRRTPPCSVEAPPVAANVVYSQRSFDACSVFFGSHLVLLFSLIGWFFNSIVWYNGAVQFGHCARRTLAARHRVQQQCRLVCHQKLLYRATSLIKKLQPRRTLP